MMGVKTVTSNAVVLREAQQLREMLKKEQEAKNRAEEFLHAATQRAHEQSKVIDLMFKHQSVKAESATEWVAVPASAPDLLKLSGGRLGASYEQHFEEKGVEVFAAPEDDDDDLFD